MRILIGFDGSEGAKDALDLCRPALPHEALCPVLVVPRASVGEPADTAAAVAAAEKE